MKAAIEHVQLQYAFSQRRACKLLMVAVSSVRYQARGSDEDLREKLVVLARECGVSKHTIYAWKAK